MYFLANFYFISLRIYVTLINEYDNIGQFTVRCFWNFRSGITYIVFLFIGFSTIIIFGWIELCCLLNGPIKFLSKQYKYQFNQISLILSKRIDVEKLFLIIFRFNFKNVFNVFGWSSFLLIKKLCVKCYYIKCCSLSLYVCSY